MLFETINTITEDLLLAARGSKISRSETISKRQIENWVHQYRALLLSRDLDKGRHANPDYIQEIPFLELEQVSLEGNGVTLGFPYEFDFPLVEGDRVPGTNYLLRTKLEIPKCIDLNFKPGFTFIGTVDGTEFQLMPEHRSRWQQHKRWGSNQTVAYYKYDRRIYLTNNNPDLDYISIRGIFENPAETARFVNPTTGITYFDINSRYPVPNNMVPVIKEMILSKELKVEASQPSDNKNDSFSGVSQNIERD